MVRSETGGGNILNYQCTGSGKHVVFLHGWGANLQAFLFVAKGLDCRSVAIDLYGFGQSPHPDYPLTIQDYARAVVDVMRRERIEKATIVGHSFGGRIAVELAAKSPEYVEKLVLIDSAGIRPRRGILYFARIFLHKFLKLFNRGLKGSADYDALDPVMKKTFVNVVNYDQTPLLKSISCKTAVFWGDKDRETPLYMAHKFHKKIKNSSLFILTNAGHFSYLDRNAVFMKILKAFLKEEP